MKTIHTTKRDSAKQTLIVAWLALKSVWRALCRPGSDELRPHWALRFGSLRSALTALLFAPLAVLAASAPTKPASEPSAWVLVPAGTFPMGALPGPDCLKTGAPIKALNTYRNRDVQADEYQGPHWDEAPIHTVTISSPYEIGTRAVTAAEFSRYQPKHQKEYEALGKTWDPNAPVVLVNWQEATDYCCWLTEQDRKEGRLAADLEYRLPTEAEWEYAAQRAQADGREFGEKDLGSWCLDWWAPYSEKSGTDPVGPENGMIRVYRGMRNDLGAKRITNRCGTLPGDRMLNVTFRLVRAKQGFRGTFREPEPVARVFQDVSQKKFDWKTDKTDQPFFSGVSETYISHKLEDAIRLPYFEGRHHGPSITWCDNGDLLATAVTNPNDGSGQMAILLTRLRAGSEQWDPPARFFILPDRGLFAAQLYHARDGSIHHYSYLGNAAGHGNVVAGETKDVACRRVSRDHGATWSDPEIVSFSMSSSYPDSSSRFFELSLAVIELSDGSILLPRDVKDSSVGTGIFKSTDNGREWKEITRVGWQADCFGKNGEQAGWVSGMHAPIWIGADGTLRAIGRATPGEKKGKFDINDRAPLSVSTDGGRTWTYGTSEFPPLSHSQSTVVKRLRDGSLLAVWFTDPSIRTFSSKDPEGLLIKDASGKERRVYGRFTALSFDDGKTWKYHKLIPNTGEWEPFWAKFQYNQKPQSDSTGMHAVTQTPDGMIHLINTHRYCSFNPAWLKEPMPAE